ncbi:hypothetical protein ACRCIL_00110 [Staphylococcus aureus]
MIRFDVNGSDHANPPLLYSSVYMCICGVGILSLFGGIAIPLKDIEDLELTDEIIESLDFFMKYTNIKHDNVIKEPRLL